MPTSGTEGTQEKQKRRQRAGHRGHWARNLLRLPALVTSECRDEGRGTRPSTPRAWHGAGFWKYGCLAGICFLGFLLKYKTCCSQGPQRVFYKCSYALSTFERCARGGSFIAMRRWLSRGQLRSGADENSASVQNMHLGLVRFK